MPNKETYYAKWLNGELSDQELEDLKASGVLGELEGIIKATDKLSLPRYDTSSAYEKFKAQRKPAETKIRQLPVRRILSIAASLIILVGFATFFLNRPTTVSAEFGMNATHDFGDGSQVVLNDGSTIKYYKRKWKTERALELTGEGFFDVESGTSFIVNTPNGSVTVLGTTFNVKSRGNNIHVECYTGKVSVKKDNEERMLTEGESVRSLNGILQDIESIDHTDSLWSIGISRFGSEQLDEVFAEMERQYDIIIERPNTNKSFSGGFAHDDLEKALKDVCQPMGLEYSISDDKKKVIIVPR